MEILENNAEMMRLYWQYTSAVKDNYKCDFDKFAEWLARDGDEAEAYIEIPSNETLSGHAEILDW